MGSQTTPDSAAAQASMAALAAAQTNPAILDPYGAEDETATHALSSVLGVTVAFIAINTLFLLLRFFTVLRLRKRRIALAWDDWFLLLAYPFVIGVCAIALVMYYYETVGGALAHEPVIQPSRLVPVIKSTLALTEIGLAAMILTRFSVLALYLRLFTDRFVRIVSYVLIVLYSCYWIGYGVAGLLECRPISYYWRQAEQPSATGKCWDMSFSRSISPPNIAFDAIMILLPLHFIWKLSMSYLRKMGLTLIIFTGIGAFIVTVVRAVMLTDSTEELKAPYLTKSFLLLMVLEPSLYFITACLPAMLPLLRLLLPHSVQRRVAPRRPLASTTHAAHSGSGSNSSGFMRLREDMPTQASQAQVTPAHGKKFDMSVMEVDNTMQMEDLRRVTEGEGVLMRTEVSVTWTTEERISVLLDL